MADIHRLSYKKTLGSPSLLLCLKQLKAWFQVTLPFSDSQRYPWTLYLINNVYDTRNNVKDIIGFLELKSLILIIHLCSHGVEMCRSLLYREPQLNIFNVYNKQLWFLIDLLLDEKKILKKKFRRKFFFKKENKNDFFSL